MRRVKSNLKPKSKRQPAAASTAANDRNTATVFDQVMAVTSAMRVEMGLASIQPEAGPKVEVPRWGRNVIQQLRKTIFRPVLKLCFRGEVNWRNYGRMIGILDRAHAFWEFDVPRILAEEFGDMTDEQAARIEARMGLDQLRAWCVKVLGRPVAEDEPLEKLVDEIWSRVVAHRERIRQAAFRHVALQPPKVAALFYKGMAEGYTSFLDEEGEFCGDRGRTNVYLSLLGCMLEVEKLRRTLPPTTRRRFYDSLTETFKLPSNAHGWFAEICDDIKFPLNNLGRPRRNSAPCL